MKRIQRKRTKGWRMPEGAVYVGRPTRWGNPWVVGDAVGVDADSPYRHTAWGARIMPTLAVELYRAALYSSLADELCWPGRRRARIMVGLGYTPDDVRRELAGATALACWCELCDEHAEGKLAGVECYLCEPCHADILLQLATAPPSREVPA